VKGFGRHIRLERIVGIRECHEFEGHGGSPEVSWRKSAAS
jgi:hypothetical protein